MSRDIATLGSSPLTTRSVPLFACEPVELIDERGSQLLQPFRHVGEHTPRVAAGAASLPVPSPERRR